MDNITAVNLTNVDLNLFHVLDTVLEEGSATRAAAKLHVTQSAVSNALARLRGLLGDRLVTIARRGHPVVGRRLTLEHFVALPHVEVALFGQPDTRVDVALAKVGRTRDVVTSVPNFASVPVLVARSDAIATVSRRLA